MLHISTEWEARRATVTSGTVWELWVSICPNKRTGIT